MRVLHVISGIEPENGGPTVALSGMVRSLTRHGMQCEIVSTWKAISAFAMASALQADGVKVKLLGPTRRPFRTHHASHAVLTEAIRHADVVHIHAVWEDIQHRAARIAKTLEKPCIWTPHGLLDRWNMKRNRLFKEACLAIYLRRAIDGVSAIHAASQFERNQLSRHRFKPPTIVRGFGVDDRLFHIHLARGSWRKVNNIDANTPIVLYLGRIQHGKGLEHLIPAIAQMRNKSVILVVAGPDEGGYRATIDQLIDRYKVGNCVRFVGMVQADDKVSLLRDADLLAAPSEHESFGIAVAEALAMGTRVVASDQVGLADVIIANNAGIVAPLQPKAFADGIDRLLERAGTIDDDRDRRRKAFQSLFDWNIIAQVWVADYHSLVRRERSMSCPKSL